MPERLSPGHPRQIILSVSVVKDLSTVWCRLERTFRLNDKASSLGKHLTATDVPLFAVGDLIPILSKADHCSAEIVAEPWLGLTAIENTGHWTLPVITSFTNRTGRRPISLDVASETGKAVKATRL